MGQPSWWRHQLSRVECIDGARGTGGTETSQYPEEEESSERPVVVASEPGCCLNRGGCCHRHRRRGCRVAEPVRGHRATCQLKGLGRPTAAGESPVGDGDASGAAIPEYHGTREILWEAGGTTLQGEIRLATDRERVP